MWPASYTRDILIEEADGFAQVMPRDKRKAKGSGDGDVGENEEAPLASDGFFDWDDMDPAFHEFTRAMIRFRKEHPLLRQKLFLHSQERTVDGREDIFWWRSDGTPMRQEDWDDPTFDALSMELRMAAETPAYGETEDAIFAVFNTGPARDWTLPELPKGLLWDWQIDTSDSGAVGDLVTGMVTIPGDSVAVFLQWGEAA